MHRQDERFKWNSVVPVWHRISCQPIANTIIRNHIIEVVVAELIKNNSGITAQELINVFIDSGRACSLRCKSDTFEMDKKDLVRNSKML